MADNLTSAQRSRAMRRIKSKDTSPEIALRLLVRELGFSGYRLHRKDLPGKPDLAWIGRKQAIFLHGCFWHGHDCPRGARIPKTNTRYWQTKIEKNRRRDIQHTAQFTEQRWRVLTVWECELKNKIALAARLKAFLTPTS
ncbi:MAG TPA: very short patch repair endonuclease [Betaproteobacteria bacterium]|nr:very short patch repair endonuclease [Betaproteobacteria bacterium]